MAAILPGAAAGMRDLEARDRPALERFAVLASFPPWAVPPDAKEAPQVVRWVDGWPRRGDAGVGWETRDGLVGAAWARPVEPVLLRDADGTPVPEVVVAVDEPARGHGIGTALVSALVARGRERGWPALVLTVSPRNPAAIAVYERCGFAVREAPEVAAASGLLQMTLDLAPTTSP